MDIELQDAVTKGQESDDAALEALKKLENPETQSTKWHIEEQKETTANSVYSTMERSTYVPDDLSLQRQIVSDHHDILVAGQRWISSRVFFCIGVILEENRSCRKQRSVSFNDERF